MTYRNNNTVKINLTSLELIITILYIFIYIYIDLFLLLPKLEDLFRAFSNSRCGRRSDGSRRFQLNHSWAESKCSLKILLEGFPIPQDTPGCSGLFFLLENPLQTLGRAWVHSQLHESLPAHPWAPGMHIHPLQGCSQSGSSRSGVRKSKWFIPKLGFSLKGTAVPTPPCCWGCQFWTLVKKYL